MPRQSLYAGILYADGVGRCGYDGRASFVESGDDSNDLADEETNSEDDPEDDAMAWAPELLHRPRSLRGTLTSMRRMPVEPQNTVEVGAAGDATTELGGGREGVLQSGAHQEVDE
jgi:hypothetical protein